MNIEEKRLRKHLEDAEERIAKLEAAIGNLLITVCTPVNDAYDEMVFVGTKQLDELEKIYAE